MMQTEAFHEGHIAMSVWLITGGAGFIGSNFVRLLAGERRGRLVVLDALTYAGNLTGIAALIESGSVEFVHGDIRDAGTVRDVFARYHIDRVVHFAAESHVDRSILGPSAFVETNVTGTLNLLQAARESWRHSPGPHRFLHVSTDEVYGTLAANDPPFNERTAYAPNSPYAASKAAADHLVRAWHATYGLPAIITNCSNNYGPWQFPEKLIPLMILNASARSELPVYGDGQQVRDWLHVQDHCEALHTVLERGQDGETYCIGGNSQQTNLHVVETICDLVDARLRRPHGSARQLIRHVEDRPGHDRRYAIDANRMRRDFAWSPRQTLDTALSSVVDWYLDNAKWTEEIRSGEFQRFYEQHYGRRPQVKS
jgi:dTDP-glucose 4,6-dehydratase